MMKVIRQVVFTPMKCGNCGNLEHVITCDKEETDYFTNIYICCNDCGNVSKVDPMARGKEFFLDIIQQEFKELLLAKAEDSEGKY